MSDSKKILLTLKDQDFQRLKVLQSAFQSVSTRKISMSDVLRRALYELPFQGVLL